MAQLNSYGSWWLELKRSNKDELTVAILVTISVLILAYLWYKWYKLTLYSSTNGAPPLPPGPRSLPIVGYLPFLSRDLHKQLTNMGHTYGPIFKFYVGSKPYIVVNTPELAKVVLRDQDEIFANHVQTVASKIITYGGQDIVFPKNNSIWRHLRKIFVFEVLNNKNLEACGCFRREEVRITIKNVFSRVGTAVNISEIAFLTSANVVTKMIWENFSETGAKDSIGNLGAELQMVAAKTGEIFGRINLSDIFPSLAWFDLQGVERDIKKEKKKLDKIFESIIEERIKYNSRKLEDGVELEGKKDFLQTLLDLKDRKDATSLNIDQIKSLLLDIMIGGTDTVTTLIEWVMAEIMQHHMVMSRVQEELAEIVGVGNIVEESHLPKLQYLHATIKETMRMHPVSTFLIPRSPSQDCTVGGYTVPKGCTVFVNAWSIHQDPRYWDNPLHFNPERFLTNKWDIKGNNLKFLPFGSGRRACPGIPMAEKMHIYILASLLHSFHWRLPEGEKLDLSEKFGVVLKKLKPLIVIPSQRLPNVSLYM